MSAVLKFSFNPGLPGVAYHTRWSDKKQAWVKYGKPFPGQWYVFLRTRDYGPEGWSMERRGQCTETISEPLFMSGIPEDCDKFIRDNPQLFKFD